MNLPRTEVADWRANFIIEWNRSRVRLALSQFHLKMLNYGKETKKKKERFK